MKDDDAREAFQLALDDVDLNEEVLFFPYGGPAPSAIAHAAFHAPDEPASADELSVFDEAGAKSLGQHQAHYRVVCWLGLPDPIILAVLRHELEHARQWKWGGGKKAFELAAAERDLMDDVGYRCLPANGQIYNLVPIELDANGAASQFVRSQEGD
jgi:hypothetical protein